MQVSLSDPAYGPSSPVRYTISPFRIHDIADEFGFSWTEVTSYRQEKAVMATQYPICGAVAVHLLSFRLTKCIVSSRILSRNRVSYESRFFAVSNTALGENIMELVFKRCDLMDVFIQVLSYNRPHIDI